MRNRTTMNRTRRTLSISHLNNTHDMFIDDTHDMLIDDVQDDPPRRQASLPPTEEEELPARSSSPQAGSKRSHNTDDEEDEEDEEECDIHVSKAAKISKKTARPKAGDYDEFGKEIVLSAANLYRALLASKDAFPSASMELKLIKKAWKLVNKDSGVNPLALTPAIVTIVSNFFYY